MSKLREMRGEKQQAVFLWSQAHACRLHSIQESELLEYGSFGVAGVGYVNVGSSGAQAPVIWEPRAGGPLATLSNMGWKPSLRQVSWPNWAAVKLLKVKLP